MTTLNRRTFMTLAAASGAALAAGGGYSRPALAGTMRLSKGGRDFSPVTMKERQAIPSSCWQCVTRDAMIGYVEDGRLVKLEGNPDSIRTRGKLCAKGQAGINQVYFPDRLLYPMKRVGERGEGKWKRITWEEALTELAGKLKALRDAGTPEKFMFHYGRMKASSAALVQTFLATYGTGTIGNHTSVCEGGKWTGQELVWGGHYDNWDFDNTNFVLNFGSNLLETHTNHIPMAQRLVDAHVDRKVPVYTFDVRLSNTAAKSDEWIPIKVGTDGAVALAMCHVVMNEGLHDPEFLAFVRITEKYEATVDEKVAALKAHLAQYTPEWAEKVSGVPAAKIKDLAVRFAKAKPACLVSYRGTIAHHNGADKERAMMMLAALTGNINRPGGRCQGVGAGWKHPAGPENKPQAKKLDILDGFPGQVAYPTHHVSHQVMKMIKDGKAGRPEVYLWYCYNPVYINGEMGENLEVLKSIPYLVTSNIVYDESSKYADLIIPDATYLERWDWEDMVSATQVAEYYIRQPLVKPLGEARDFADVCCDLAERMGFPMGFKSKEEFVRMSCEMTPGVKEAGGFDYMKKHGVWHDANAKPDYYGFKKEVAADALTADGVILDEATGVYWNWKKAKAKSEEEAKKAGYTHTKGAYKAYVGQKIGNKVYVGFKPDKLNKSGYFELYSTLLKEKNQPVIPTYVPTPEFEAMAPDELIMTTYKVAVHTHSRTAHLKWLSELYHDNPAWINPKTAAERGIQDGDRIKVSNKVGEITTRARVTQAVIPGIVAISHHVGRSESGRFGSGSKSPMGSDDDPDLKLMWWKEHGVHPNHILLNSPDPISGQQRWMDTVVRVAKA